MKASRKWTREGGEGKAGEVFSPPLPLPLPLLHFKPIVLSLGIIFCLAPTLCQFHYSRWRHIGLFIARPGYSSLTQLARPAKYACSAGYQSLDVLIFSFLTPSYRKYRKGIKWPINDTAQAATIIALRGISSKHVLQGNVVSNIKWGAVHCYSVTDLEQCCANNGILHHTSATWFTALYG